MESRLCLDELQLGPSLFRGQQLQQNSVLLLMLLKSHQPMSPVAKMATVKEAARTANEAFSVGFMFPCSHPGFDPLSEKLWQPFVQGRLYFPEKSGDFSCWSRTRLVPLPAWGCALWSVCISPLPPHL